MRLLYWQYFYLVITLSSYVCYALFGTDFIHDQTTVYCYVSNSSYRTGVTLTAAQVLTSAVGQSCPIAITLTVDSTTVAISQTIRATWNVSFYPQMSNPLNLQNLYTGWDEVSQEYYQIVHSNLHTCQYGSSCSPFEKGINPETLTPTKVGNFTAYKISFSSINELSFSRAGDHSLVAHIILPGATQAQRYDFCVYAKVSVSESSKKSLPWIIGFVVAGAIVFVGIIIIVTIRLKNKKRGSAARVQSPHEPLVLNNPSPKIEDYSNVDNRWTAVYSESSTIPSAINIGWDNTRNGFKVPPPGVQSTELRQPIEPIPRLETKSSSVASYPPDKFNIPRNTSLNAEEKDWSRRASGQFSNASSDLGSAEIEL